ncbi:MAG: fucose pyrophosphorylase domain-containing protein [Planctomycetota bacterium]
MRAKLNQWDYLIITASNEAQALAYESQLKIRQDLGLLSNVRDVLVVADPGGKRIGSGGSTLYCLMEVLNRQLAPGSLAGGPDAWKKVLADLRILIVHAGGDSKRLPAYGPCGKIFVPVPCKNDTAVPAGLFDRQLPTYLALPEPAAGAGQVLITSGDVLLRFEPSEVRFADRGVTGLACYALPEQASRHGVFCRGRGDQVKVYLQKPSVTEQQEKGAVDAYGQSCLDIGVMNLDAETAAKMLDVFGASLDKRNKVALSGPMGKAVFEHGLDFYREICCAMGAEASRSDYRASARSSGSEWNKSLLDELFDAFSPVPFSMNLLKRCDFLDFGASRAIIGSGTRLLQEDRGASNLQTSLSINNEISEGGAVKGTSSWVEGCRISSSLTLGGENLVVGVDVDEPISLPRRACLDVIKGQSRHGRAVWFVRCYSINDTFKEPIERSGSFCGFEVLGWLKAVGARPQDVWDRQIPAGQRSIWNARMFPAVRTHGEYKRWLWMFDPKNSSSEDAGAWREADRYNLEQILAMADHEDFYRRRNTIRAEIIRHSLRQVFHPRSGLSSCELEHLLRNAEDLSAWVSEILTEANWHFRNSQSGDVESLAFPRIIHTLGSALEKIYRDIDRPLSKALPGLNRLLSPAENEWLSSLGLGVKSELSILEWARAAQRGAFEALENAIVAGGSVGEIRPRSVLRSDEIVWGRAPARLDVGGGWTDTPPYSLEYGGCVVNAAVNLNGQPPIQAYARVIDEPVVRIASIDLGARIEISNFDELLDYRKATGNFALAKAALALSCLSPGNGAGEVTLKKALEQFGGGIELTTLAAIPKGSGLGTSSIMGAVILAAIQRVMGKELSRRELFHSVLRLEQALTTGGGWQDQIGGAVGGVKMVVTEPGFVPDARIHHVLPDILDPKINGGLSLLYYTGVTRLAKNILQQVVARHLNRHRPTMATLRQMRTIAEQVAQSLICKDIATFGNLIDVAWQLNKQLDPNSTNNEIESLFERVRPFIYGAKLLGAGGGGFMLMICKSPADASAVREMLESEPPNERARFFDFDVSKEGLTVTVS